MDTILLAVARSFAAKVKANFDTPVRAQPEDQLKAPVVELIEGAGRLLIYQLGWSMMAATTTGRPALCYPADDR